MVSRRDKVSLRRLSILSGVFGGCLLTVFTHGMGLTPKAKYSLFFGSRTHWPAFFKGFLPLDLAEACLMFGLMGYLLFGIAMGELRLTTDSPLKRTMQRAALTITIPSAFVCFCGCLVGGWETGIEYFLFMGILMGILLAVSGGVSMAATGLTNYVGAWRVRRKSKLRRMQADQAHENFESCVIADAVPPEWVEEWEGE